MTVVKIEDYRPPPKSSEPCTISFFTPTFSTDGNIQYNVEVLNGDFEGALENVRQQGGLYLPSQDDGKSFWFLPWPCAAVRISKSPK